MSLWKQVIRYRKNRNGSVSIEFALITPLILLLYLGVTEINAYLGASRQVIHANRLIADLVAQQTTISSAQFADMQYAVREIMAPLQVDNSLGMVISSIKADPNKNESGIIEWSYNLIPNGTQRIKDSSITIPGDLEIASQSSVILSETEFTYKPFFSLFFGSEYKLRDQLYTWPRNGLKLPCDDCS